MGLTADQKRETTLPGIAQGGSFAVSIREKCYIDSRFFDSQDVEGISEMFNGFDLTVDHIDDIRKAETGEEQYGSPKKQIILGDPYYNDFCGSGQVHQRDPSQLFSRDQSKNARFTSAVRFALMGTRSPFFMSKSPCSMAATWSRLTRKLR